MGIMIIQDGKMINRSFTESQYDGDKTGGEFKKWKTLGTSPNDFMLKTYGKLSSRNATLYSTSAIARACVNKPLSYAIGDGIVFRSYANGAYLGWSPEKTKEWSRRFSELLHLEKQAISYYKKQETLFREAKITGDSVLFFLRGDDNDIQGAPFDLVSSYGGIIDWKYSEKANFTLGIKHDKFLRRKGFQTSTTNEFVPFRSEDGSQNAIQFLFQERAGQLRGYGCFYSEIARAKNLDRVWDATIERMALEATTLGYFNASTTDVTRQAQEQARLATGRQTGSTSKDGSISEIGNTTDQVPGGMYVLKNDEAMSFTDLKTPSDNFGMANEWAVKMFGMATTVPPEVILGEYSTSYTAHKGALNDFTKKFMQDRKTFINVVDNKVNLEYLKVFIERGDLEKPENFDVDQKVQMACLAGVHLGVVPGHINPLQEVRADILADDAGYTTKSTIANKFGHDFENMMEEWEQEQNRWFNASPSEQAKLLFAQEKNEQINPKSQNNSNTQEPTQGKKQQPNEENQ